MLLIGIPYARGLFLLMTRLICSDILKLYVGVQRETAACVSLANYVGVSFAASTRDTTNFNYCNPLHQVIFALVF